jgi:hypothetical protein
MRTPGRHIFAELGSETTVSRRLRTLAFARNMLAFAMMLMLSFMMALSGPYYMMYTSLYASSSSELISSSFSSHRALLAVFRAPPRFLDGLLRLRP